MQGKATCRVDDGPPRPCIANIVEPTWTDGLPVPGEWTIETRITWDERRRSDANRGAVEMEISTGDGTLRGRAYLTGTEPTGGTEEFPLKAWLKGDGRPRTAAHHGDTEAIQESEPEARGSPDLLDSSHQPKRRSVAQ